MFYNELSKVYDVVFPISEATVTFLSRNLKENSKILDLACGTGNYSLELAKKGHQVIGLDLNKEMISKANIKSGEYAVEYYCKDMLNIKDVVEYHSLNMIFCIGNSIVHLPDKSMVQKLLKDCYNSLKKEGSLVLQTINYDRIINKKITSLPTIDRSSEGVKFIRNYNLHEDKSKVDFNTKLMITKSESSQVFENSVALLALTSDELVKLLQEAGFKDIQFFGDFKESEFNIDSYALVIRSTVD